MKNTREILIQNIKDCGQALLDNAENIVGDYKFLAGLTITCYVDECDREPHISIDTEFIPEKWIERLQ